jgi:3-deoxy-D-manno-octulosonic-acid transferase
VPFAAVYLLWHRVASRIPAALGRAFRLGAPAEMGRAGQGIHAVSVGETQAARPLISALATQFPAHRFPLTI